MSFHRDELQAVKKLVRKISQRYTIIFEPPAVRAKSDTTKLKDKGFVCRHGRFRFESCTSCKRSLAEAQAELRKIQRMYE